MCHLRRNECATTGQRDFLTGAIALFTVAGVIAVTSLVIFILESC